MRHGMELQQGWQIPPQEKRELGRNETFGSGVERKIIYLHNKLNRSPEVSKKLEYVVDFLLLHLIHPILLAASMNLSFCQAHSCIGLQQVFRNNACTSSSWVFLFFLFDVAILRFEVVDQSVHILIFVLIFDRLGVGMVGVLLTEGTRFDVGVQMIRFI